MPAILIVDEHLLTRQGLKQILASEYRAVEFGEAKDRDAVRILLARRTWDLIVLNLGPAAHDGLSLLREIRKLDELSRVLVIDMNPDPSHESKTASLGGTDYLSAAAQRTAVRQEKPEAAVERRQTDLRIGFENCGRSAYPRRTESIPARNK